MSLELSPSQLKLTINLLPAAARKDFDFWRDHIEPVLALNKGVCAKLAEISRTTGVHLKTVHRKYYAAKSRGLLALVDKRLAGPKYWNTRNGLVSISDDDKHLVRLYCDKNQRSSRSAVKKMRKDWQRGLIKTETPIDPRTQFPRGWSIDNLARYAPPEFERKAARLGRSAAAAHRPLVYGTRKHLWVGSHYMFDDMWHNFEINSFSERQAGRPLELFSHDLFSARKIRWGIRVRVRKDDDSGFHGLTERMTRMILAATLYLDGYSPRGTVCIEEAGTARLSRGNIARDLYEISNKLITIEGGGMQGAKAHAGQYEGISRGNPKIKAALESSNNLTQNVFGFIPGQTGKDRQHQPEEHPALMRNNADLLAARSQLIDAGQTERANILEFTLLELQQFMAIAAALYRYIDEDPDHDLEGWDLFTVNELLLGGQWIDQRLLDAPQAELALALVRDGKLETRPRKMTRGEVWRAGCGELIQFPGHGVCAILGDDLAVERKVRSNMFEFEDREVGPGVHRYDTEAVCPHGERIRLADGETYETFVNPFAPETLFVRRANGAYLGECRRIEKVCRTDVEGWQRRCGEAAKTEAALLAPVRARHLADAREKTRRHLTNAAVLQGTPLTPRDRIHAAQESLHEKAVRKIDNAAVEELAEPLTQPQATTDDFSAEELL